MSIPEDFIDLGCGHTVQFTGFAPDRDLNPQYADIPDDPRVGAIITHSTPSGEPCTGSISFDTETVRKLRALSPIAHRGPVWQVGSWDPLTVSPSLLCSCGDHGFIRDGKWVPA